MNNLKLYFLFIIVSFLIISCGYIKSGTWENDDKNWNRVYSYELPDSIELIHSWYQRSPHWTLEETFYFETKFNEVIKENFIESLIRIDSTKYNRIEFLENRPDWFVSKDLTNYEIWVAEDEYDNFIFFIDKSNKHLFWTDYQF